MDDLRHRMKNTLTMVQAIAAQTFRDSDAEGKAAAHAFSERLLALARAYDALVQTNWKRANLRALVMGTIEIFGPADRERFRISGPEVHLDADTALMPALALHELATNAAKYGALSNDAGHVDIAWSVHDDKDAPRLHLIWQEHGGPPVVPPKRRSFGTRLIERALPRELGGAVTLSYDPAGVRCEIEAPLPAH
jgi:two-component sensor histidine kinase